MRPQRYRLARQSSTLSWPRNPSERFTGQYLQEPGVSPFCQMQPINEMRSTGGAVQQRRQGRALGASLRSGGRGALPGALGAREPTEQHAHAAGHTRARSRRRGRAEPSRPIPARSGLGRSQSAAAAAATSRRRPPPRRTRPRSFPPALAVDDVIPLHVAAQNPGLCKLQH